MIGVLGDAYKDAQTMNVAAWNRTITLLMIEVSSIARIMLTPSLSPPDAILSHTQVPKYLHLYGNRS